ncbi:MAG: hypothetical protein JW747_06245 [Candidatus Aminicenantes bacterium]|nr:hypothetical protein [Candidatus Aminicenantes bacterium]
MRKTVILISCFLAIAVMTQAMTPDAEISPAERQRAAARSADPDWSTPVNVSNTGSDSFTPRVGVDKDGAAYVLWTDWTDVPQIVYFKTNRGGTWSGIQTVHRMSYQSGEACFPEFVTSPEGVCHLVLQDVIQSYEILYYQFKDNVWKGPENVSSNAEGASIYSSIAISPVDDSVYSVWMDEVSSEWDLMSSYRDEETTFGWDWPFLIPLFGGYQYFPNVAVDGQGTLHLVFHTRDGENSSVWYVKNETPRNNAGWTSPVPVASNTGTEWCYPRIASDDNGDVAVVWNGRTAAGNLDVFLRRTVNGAWQATENVSQASDNSAGVCVAVNRETGDIYVSWHELVNDIWQVLFKSFEAERTGGEKKWSEVFNLSNSPRFAAYPRMAVNEEGDVHVVYSDRKSGVFDVYHTFKAKIRIYPPVNATLTTSFNKVLFYTEKINTITFEENPENDPSMVTGYNIYRKEADESNDKFVLLATLDTSTFLYDDRRLPHDVKYAYAVTTTDVDGNESKIDEIVTEQ